MQIAQSKTKKKPPAKAGPLPAGHHRIHVRFGSMEFNAEGADRATIEALYDQFLAVVREKNKQKDAPNSSELP